MNGDKRILELHDTIAKAINDSGLVPGVVYYILKDITNEVYEAYDHYAHLPEQETKETEQGAE